MLKSHPTTVINGKRSLFPIYGTKTGWSVDNPKKRQSDLKDLGTNVTLYFKFTKYLILLYLFLTIITIPHVVFYILGGTEDYNNSKSITSFFGLTTLGNLGSAYSTCNFGTSFTSDISLLCKFGNIDDVEVFGEEKADGSTTCNNDGDDLQVDSS